MSLDIYSAIPLHVQLKEILIKEIKCRNYTDKLPSERDLMERFNISRTTVREALSALVNARVVEKIHGRGTFITSHPINEWLGNLSSITEIIESMGMEPGIRLLFQGIQSNPEIGKILGVKEYYAIERLRFANDDPIAIERNYYPLSIGQKLKEYDLNKVALYTVLESIGVLHEAEQLITCTIPNAEEAKLLGLVENTRDTSVLKAETEGNTVEYYRAIYRGDKYAFQIRLFRNK